MNQPGGLDRCRVMSLLDLFAELQKTGRWLCCFPHTSPPISRKCADDILYIRDGKPVANCSMDDFIKNCCEDSESLEDAILPHGKGRQGMIKLLRKEIQLAHRLVSYFFIGFGLMAFVPGYPILVGSFFVCPWAVPAFQTAREANDLTYTALLPVAKHDVVRANMPFAVLSRFAILH